MCSAVQTCLRGNIEQREQREDGQHVHERRKETRRKNEKKLFLHGQKKAKRTNVTQIRDDEVNIVVGDRGTRYVYIVNMKKRAVLKTTKKHTEKRTRNKYGVPQIAKSV